MNPMLTTLNRQANPQIADQIGQLKSVAGALRNPGTAAKNAVMAQLQNHPLYPKAKEVADRYGGDWNRAFVEVAKQNGIDPNQITSMLRQQGLA